MAMMRVGASCQWLRLRVLYVVAFLDLLAVSMIIPSLSTYVKSMDGGASSPAQLHSPSRACRYSLTLS